MHRLGRLVLLALLIAGPPLPAPAAAMGPEASVVHIRTFSQRPRWDEPWRFDHVRETTGTGFVIPGRRILTNAHVVSWAKEILVKRHQQSRPFVASVRFIAHDGDLALLEVPDPEFFDGVAPLLLGELPRPRSSVTTVGYPAGGDQISYTRGVVSRIESQRYSHVGTRSFLAVQTDAAINPGNSGGPVMQGERVVGVAFQGRSRLENTGYFIPTPIIRHFLEDVEDGRYDGFPESGLVLAKLENAAYRRHLGLPETLDGRGVRVDHFLPVPATEARMRVDDVLLAVNGHPVGSDGAVLYEGNRVQVGVLFDGAQAGDSLHLEVFREGARTEVDLPVQVYTADRAEGTQYERLPRYFVYAGLVFLTLSADYLATFGEDQGAVEHPRLHYTLYHHGYEHPEGRREENVVLAQVLPHPVNADLRRHERSLVDRVNGVRVDRIEDLLRAFDGEDGPYHVIEFLERERFAVIDREAAEAAHSGILRAYGLGADRRL